MVRALTLVSVASLVILGCDDDSPRPVGDDDVASVDDDDDIDLGDDDTGDGDIGDDDTAQGGCETTQALEGCDFVVPDSCPTIQAAILAASYQDFICVQPGTYYENVSFSGREVAVLGLGGVEGTIIDGSGAGAVVAFTQDEGPSATLSGFTLRNGEWVNGGGVYIRDADPTLWKLRIEGNVATDDGGGLYIRESTALLLDVEILGNHAEDQGGALYLWDASPVLDQVLIESNTATETAGLYLYNSHPTLTDVTIAGNYSEDGVSALSVVDSAPVTSQLGIYNNAAPEGATVYMSGNDVHLAHVDIFDNTAERGGGVKLSYASNGSEPVLEHVSITGNEATVYGGGIYLTEANPLLSNILIEGNHSGHDGGGIAAWAYHSYGTVELHNVAVVGNTADRYGGGIMLTDDASVQAHNTTIIGNQAAEDGGGVYHEGSSFTADHVVIAGNQSTGIGGGVWVGYGSFLATNSILTANTASSGGGLFNDWGSVELQYTNVFGNSPDDLVGVADPTGLLGNVSVDPEFLDTDSEQPSDWDLHLSTPSPLVDAGDFSDLDPDGSSPDIGAYGGPHAGGWDLDRDGWFEWWVPGEYDPVTYPGHGWDCDDRDAGVYPGSGC